MRKIGRNLSRNGCFSCRFGNCHDGLAGVGAAGQDGSHSHLVRRQCPRWQGRGQPLHPVRWASGAPAVVDLVRWHGGPRSGQALARMAPPAGQRQPACTTGTPGAGLVNWCWGTRQALGLDARAPRPHLHSSGTSGGDLVAWCPRSARRWCWGARQVLAWCPRSTRRLCWCWGRIHGHHAHTSTAGGTPGAGALAKCWPGGP